MMCGHVFPGDYGGGGDDSSDDGGGEVSIDKAIEYLVARASRSLELEPLEPLSLPKCVTPGPLAACRRRAPPSTSPLKGAIGFTGHVLSLPGSCEPFTLGII